MLSIGLAGRPGPGPRQVPKYAPALGTFGGTRAFGFAVVVVGATVVVVVVERVVAGAGGAAADSDEQAAASAIRSASPTTDGPARLPARSVVRIVTSCTGTASSSRAPCETGTSRSLVRSVCSRNARSSWSYSGSSSK